MATKFYTGINDVARQVKKPYAEVGGVARTIKMGYIGIDGIARTTFDSKIRGWFTFHTNLNSIDFRGDDLEWYREYHEFPFTTLEGTPYNSIYLIDDGMAGIPLNKMWFGRNSDDWSGSTGTLVYSQNDFWNDYTNPGWKAKGYKSIYLDNLELGVDISQDAYDFLLKVAYPDNTLSGKPQTYTIEAGSYGFPVGPTSQGLLNYDWSSPAITISVPFRSNSRDFSRIEFKYYMDIVDANELFYVSLDGTSTMVYEQSWYSDEAGTTGWKGAYSGVVLLADVQVSKTTYDWWALNTTRYS